MLNKMRQTVPASLNIDRELGHRARLPARKSRPTITGSKLSHLFDVHEYHQRLFDVHEYHQRRHRIIFPKRSRNFQKHGSGATCESVF
jgi:hypothetical protein